MKLPVEISPNPLVTSTVELRFVSEVQGAEILSMMVEVFFKDFPKFREGKFPKEIKDQEPELKYHPDYILSNENFSIGFSDNVLRFENVSSYPLWGNYFPFLQRNIDRFLGLGIANKFERIGLRYASVLEGVDITTALKSTPIMQFDANEQQFVSYRSNVKVGNFNLLLQVLNNVQIASQKRVFSGLMIDIDASVTEGISNAVSIFNLIDSLHQEQKRLFFGILRQEYIDQLNPKY